MEASGEQERDDRLVVGSGPERAHGDIGRRHGHGRENRLARGHGRPEIVEAHPEDVHVSRVGAPGMRSPIENRHGLSGPLRPSACEAPVTVTTVVVGRA